MLFVCLSETFYFEVIAFPDSTLSSVDFRAIRASAAPLEGLQGRVDGGKLESENSFPPRSWHW